MAERIFLKSLTSPINAHVVLSNSVLLNLLSNTDFEYHRELAEQLLKMMQALYKEIKQANHAPFKKKVLFKINYAVSLFMSHSDAETLIFFLQKQRTMI